MPLVLLTLIDEAGAISAIHALPHFVSSDNDGTQRAVIQRIRRGLIARSSREVTAASSAVHLWIKLAQNKEAPALPRQLIEQVVSAIETRRETGLHALLWCARRLVEVGALIPDDLERLASALGDLIVEIGYDRIGLESQEAITVSLKRAECVRLARALQTSGLDAVETNAWIEAARDDPLPELRFALLETESI